MLGVDLKRGRGEDGRSPEVRGEVGVGVAHAVVSGMEEVTHGTGLTLGGGVSILNTGEGEELLDSVSGNDTGTTGSRDDTETDGTALSRDLARNGVGSASTGAPVATTNGDEVELSVDDGTADSAGGLVGTTNTKTDVTVHITDDDPGLETSALTRGGLLLNGRDLHASILKVVLEEVVNDLVLLDLEREHEDLVNGLDLAVLHETTELGAGNPSLLLVTATTASATGAITLTLLKTRCESTTGSLSSAAHYIRCGNKNKNKGVNQLKVVFN